MKKALAAAAILFTLHTPAAHAVAIFGNIDCGKWVRTPNNTQKTWLLGYLSGLAQGLSKPGFDPLNKLNSAEQAYLWMDNYCATHPLKSEADGAEELWFELIKAK
ncbi:hypothetical protein [Cupriavidus taiwanensis]|uniref:Rap1a immunity protein domain-containing protein n=1 Tax=Cupriavidus taiwanensis (strain DSM 17343 / BCRC 17206 / CCUG 44338 / CIP 107171 / LMG 19424 / R1) TaxID=977880 RepID=B3R9J1_CUPTR|nr:hypothetical protein [Cupriavidus taiwanensis]CAQ71566.1 hypothetical protein; putative exported protein [Cupriavidus taiwanensis LMG 19424]